MILSRAFAAVLAGVGILVQSATAHSTQRNPLSYVTRIDDANIQTPSHRIQALSSFEISFHIHDRKQKIRLRLEPNHDIFTDDAAIRYIRADGTVHMVEPINRLEHKVYKGNAFIRLDGETEWTNAGWARISVQRDGARPIFEGALQINGDHHHIQTSGNYRRTAIEGDPEIASAPEDYMILWRDSDIISSIHADHADLRRDIHGTQGCTSDSLLYNRDENNLVYRAVEQPRDTSPWAQMSPASIFGRQNIDGGQQIGTGAGVNLQNSIGSTVGCPSTRKVALVGIATDCNYAAAFESNNTLRQNVISMVNMASQLYESTFNISLGIQNLTVTDAKCPSPAPASAPWNSKCSNDVDITKRLNLFSEWRGLSKDNNAYWTLLTTCATGAAVGLAWLGQVCVPGTQVNGGETVAAANVVVKTSTEWQVFAHETGHTFGAVHDCVPTSCNDGSVAKQQCCPLSSSSCDAQSEFIMNPSTATRITRFSPCSIGNICSFLGRNSARVTCLANNKDVSTITGSQCGNGIVESGEDCDCGGETGCTNNPCCDAKTCKFTTGSVCDPSNEECCTTQCKFKSQGSVCRASTGSCDPAETCPGDSPNCPTDQTSPDGTTCGNSNNLQCASGQCTSRDLQCKTLMGSLTAGNDTYSCSSQGCILSCASPEFGKNTCWSMQQYFLDGTPCEGGGKCSLGNCQGATLGNQIGSWITDNKNIVIPVAAVVGGLILLAFVSCIWNCCRRRRRVPRVVPPPPPAGWGQYPVQGMRSAPPPPMADGRFEAYRAPQPGQMGFQPGPFEAPRQQRTASFRYA